MTSRYGPSIIFTSLHLISYFISYSYILYESVLPGLGTIPGVLLHLDDIFNKTSALHKRESSCTKSSANAKEAGKRSIESIEIVNSSNRSIKLVNKIPFYYYSSASKECSFCIKRFQLEPRLFCSNDSILRFN